MSICEIKKRYNEINKYIENKKKTNKNKREFHCFNEQEEIFVHREKKIGRREKNADQSKNKQQTRQ